MQLNETNIVNQLEKEIQFSNVVPGETARRAVGRFCSVIMKRNGYRWIIIQIQNKITLWPLKK